jgi:HSP20 family protein
LSEKKETPSSVKKPLAVSKKKTESIQPKKSLAKTSLWEPIDLWQPFDEVFERFRKDFQDLLLPSSKALVKSWAGVPEIRAPVVDLQDRGKDFLLKAEMPGFKKDDVAIQVFEDAVEISGTTGWKYDKKSERYICKERACESFYRLIPLPERVLVDDVNADLKDGVLEVTLLKKEPKKSKKVALK